MAQLNTRTKSQIPWAAVNMPDLTDKTAVITGAEGGLGREIARRLAAAGATVVMACLDAADGEAAAAEIRQALPQAALHVRQIDLGDLASIHRFGTGLGAVAERIDILINNAGVMALPDLRTSDGFEMQMGVNHLGHFALTGLLLDHLRTTRTARVVTVSSFAHTFGRLNLDDLHFQRRRYGKWLAYAQSKLANMLFALELQRRLAAQQDSTISVAAHPGYAATPLLTASTEIAGSRFWQRFMTTGNRLVAQAPAAGALPILYAATAENVGGGEFFGPDGFTRLRGNPTRTPPAARARERYAAGQLWQLSEAQTGVRYLS